MARRDHRRARGITAHAEHRSGPEFANESLALADAAPAYRDAPETRAHRARGAKLKDALVAAAAPRATAAQRAFAGELIFATMASLGKHVSERRPSRRTVDRWADAVSTMLVAYLGQLR